MLYDFFNSSCIITNYGKGEIIASKTTFPKFSVEDGQEKPAGDLL